MSADIDFDGGTLFSMTSVFEATDQGDFRLLVERLRDLKVVIQPNEREFLADFLEGKVKLRRGRREDKLLTHRKALVYATYYWLTTVDDWPKHAAQHRCREIYGLSLRTVQNYLKELERRDFGYDTLMPHIDEWK